MAQLHDVVRVKETVNGWSGWVGVVGELRGARCMVFGYRDGRSTSHDLSHNDLEVLPPSELATGQNVRLNISDSGEIVATDSDTIRIRRQYQTALRGVGWIEQSGVTDVPRWRVIHNNDRRVLSGRVVEGE